MRNIFASSAVRSLWRQFAFVLAIVTIALFAISAHAGGTDGSVGINSVSPLRLEFANAYSMKMELEVSNDGSRGPIYGRLVVRSRDGRINTSASTGALAVGARQRISVELRAPWTYFGRDTDVVIATIRSSADQSILAILSVPQRFSWGEHVAPPPKKPGPYLDWRNANGFSEALIRNFDDQTFAELDSLLDQLHVSAEKSVDGDLHIHAFWKLLATAYRYPNPKLWLQKWKDDTGSLWATLAIAAYEREIARRIVGGDDHAVADPLAAGLSHKRIERARAMLEAARPKGRDNRIWHELRIWTAYDLQDDKEVRTAFDEATSRFPAYRHYYTILARYWTPKSRNKNWDELQRILDLALERTATADGTGMYFYAYLSVLQNQTVEFDVFRDSPATWPRMRKALEDLLARYPDAASTKNYYAAYACRAGDEKTFSSAWWKLGTDEDLEFWPTNYSPELCKSKYLKQT